MGNSVRITRLTGVSSWWRWSACMMSLAVSNPTTRSPAHTGKSDWKLCKVNSTARLTGS